MGNPQPADLTSPSTAPFPARDRIVAPIPHPLTRFIGRKRDIAAITTRLSEARLVTLTGPGGVGKTRLAIAVGRNLEPVFADGVAFISLASVHDATLVMPTVAQALGAHAVADRASTDVVVATLRDRALLLILDNLEQVVEAAPQVAQLLARCPRLTVLATSRVPLRITGEQRYPVAPLVLPDPVDTPAQQEEAEAVQLFTARAQSVDPTFAITPDTAPTIAAICQRLDGLPLALELAAARTDVLSPAALLGRLDHTLPLLTGGPRDALEHQRTVRDTIAWSYDLVHPGDQALFRRLSVFVGGFTLEAAQAVAGDLDRGPGDHILNGVSALKEQSLVYRYPDAGGVPRFGMLETVREYGAEQLVAHGEEQAARERHATWCLELAATDISMFHPFRHTSRVQRLESEHANLRAALTWLHTSGQEAALAELVNRLRWLWYLGGHFAEGQYWYERALARSDTHTDVLLCDLLRGMGQVAHFNGDRAARAYLERALELSRNMRDVHREAETRYLLAVVDEDTGSYAQADSMLRHARELYAQATDPWGQAACDYHLGIIAYGLGHVTAASGLLDQAVDAATAGNDDLLPVWCRNYQILIACAQGNVDRATALVDEQRRAMLAGVLDTWDNVAAAAGVVAASCGEHALAARLLGAAAAIRHDVPFDLPERTAFLEAARRARLHLGDATFERAWEEGQGMRPTQIDAELDRLRTSNDTSTQHRASAARLAGLTEREVEVLRLMAAGRTDQQIADALFISRRTAEWHVRNVLGKLGAVNRAEATAIAARDHLL